MSDRIEDLQKRLAKDPNSKIFAQLAEEFRRAGMLREAIATCRDGLSRHPTYFSARVALGRALLQAGNFEEARVELEKVLAQVPDNILAHKFLGETYHHLGKLEEALAKYETAQNLSPGDVEVAERIGQLTEEIHAFKQPKPQFRPVQDDLAIDFDATPVTSDPPAAGSQAVSDREFAVEGEMLFDARNPTPVEAEIVLEAEEKPVTSVFERQAREMRDSGSISDDARALQEQFEAGPMTSSFTRQAREIRDAGKKTVASPPPAPMPAKAQPAPAPPPPRLIETPPPAVPPAVPEEDIEVGELTSFFLGRQAPIPAPSAKTDASQTYAPPPIPERVLPPLLEPKERARPSFEVDRVPGTESFAFLGDKAPVAFLESEAESGENLTSRALADLYYSQKHYEQALALYQNLQGSAPSDTELHSRIDEVKRVLGAAAPPQVLAPPVARAHAEPQRRAPAPPAREDFARAAIRTLELWLSAIQKR